MFCGQFANTNQVARGITGGTLTSDATYRYRTFTSSGNINISKGGIVGEVFAVGGGGRTFDNHGASAGQVTYNSSFRVRASLTVNIGANSSSTELLGPGTTGSDNLTVSGASYTTSGNGFPMGSTSTNPFWDSLAGGGGAGSTTSGQNGFTNGAFAQGGNGGFGQENPWYLVTNTPQRVGGGSGGNAFEYYYGQAFRGTGTDGGGNGQQYRANYGNSEDGSPFSSIGGTEALANTGSGGGGGFPGASGLAIVRYLRSESTE
jgi:hypothetical protein